jgi:transcriptional regulator with XRE-family HTH domain
MSGRTLPKRQRLVLLPKIRRLAIERAAAGKTVKEIAQETGLSYPVLTHLLSGSQYSNEYATRMAKKLADYFGRPLEELFFSVDLENPDDSAVA